MAEARGRRGKKTAWQVTLGLKEAVFAALGIAGLMMISFALGTLAGRGDIFWVAHRWGLMGPEVAKVVPPPTPVTLPPAAPHVAAVTPPPLPSPSPPAGQAASTPASAGPAPARKAAPKPGSSQSQKQKEEELRKLREEMARKMKFQNSLDTPSSRSGAKSGKGKAKEGEKAPAAPVVVARFTDKKAAQAKLAELRKQGQKVTLKEGRNQQGVFYAVVRQPSGEGQSPAAGPNQNQKKKSTP